MVKIFIILVGQFSLLVVFLIRYVDKERQADNDVPHIQIQRDVRLNFSSIIYFLFKMSLQLLT